MHDFHGTSRDLLHAANLRHGTDGFTSPPKEGVLRIFSPLKIRRLRPGLNPRTWVPKASTLPLDHRSRSYIYIYIYIYCGAAAQSGLWPPHSWGFLITHNDASQSVGLLWTSDQLVAETLPVNTQNSQQTSMSPVGFAAADLRLRPCGHWDRHIYIYIYMYIHTRI